MSVRAWANRLTRVLGQEEFDRLRSLSYAETHVILICFSVSVAMILIALIVIRGAQVDNPTSLENVESKVCMTHVL